jgi:hypothetical protein
VVLPEIGRGRAAQRLPHPRRAVLRRAGTGRDGWAPRRNEVPRCAGAVLTTRLALAIGFVTRHETRGPLPTAAARLALGGVVPGAVIAAQVYGVPTLAPQAIVDDLRTLAFETAGPCSAGRAHGGAARRSAPRCHPAPCGSSRCRSSRCHCGHIRRRRGRRRSACPTCRASRRLGSRSPRRCSWSAACRSTARCPARCAICPNSWSIRRPRAATARALGEAIVTQADTVQGLHANVRDALRCHFDDGAAPRMIRLHFARDEVITARNGHATCPAPT